jgi:hypothetical protein
MTLTACGPVPSQPMLDAVAGNCSKGDYTACAIVPMWQAQVQQEKDIRRERIGDQIFLVVGLIAALGGAAVIAANPPTYIQPVPVYVCRSPRWC